MFGKLGIVLAKEYLIRVRSRAFVIGTVLGPLGITALMVGPTLLADKTGVGHQKMVVVDASSSLVDQQLAAEMGVTLGEAAPDRPVSFYRYDEFDGDTDAAREVLADRVESEEIDGFVIIADDFYESGRATYYGAKLSGVIQVDNVENALDKILHRYRLQGFGMDDGQIASLIAGASLHRRHVSDEGDDVSLGVRILAGITMIFALYMMILIYGVQSMNSVIEDKTSRVVEVMLASVTPTQLMTGKVMGNGLVGLTQFVIWALFALLLTKQPFFDMPSGVNLDVISPTLWLTFGVFFLLGYLLFANIYASVGALCSTLQDAQQYQGPITLLIIIPMVMMSAGLQSPDSSLMTWLSMIPVFAPILMFMRVVAGSPPMWQVLLSIGLLLLSVILLSRAGGKLFRLGILSYGKAPSWGQAIRMLQAPE